MKYSLRSLMRWACVVTGLAVAIPACSSLPRVVQPLDLDRSYLTAYSPARKCQRSMTAEVAMRFRHYVLLLLVTSVLPGCAKLQSTAYRQLDHMSSNHDPYRSGNP